MTQDTYKTLSSSLRRLIDDWDDDEADKLQRRIAKAAGKPIWHSDVKLLMMHAGSAHGDFSDSSTRRVLRALRDLLIGASQRRVEHVTEVKMKLSAKNLCLLCVKQSDSEPKVPTLFSGAQVTCICADRRWTRDKSQAEEFETSLQAWDAANETEFNCGVENLAGER